MNLCHTIKNYGKARFKIQKNINLYIYMYILFLVGGGVNLFES